MAVDYDPFGVYVIIEREGRIIVEDAGDIISLPFSYGENKETPQKCAKRIIRTITSETPTYIKSLPFVERKAIDTIPMDIKKKWPKGAVTIPVYAFSYSLSKPSFDLASSFTFMEKKEAGEKVSKLQHKVIYCD